MIIHNADDAVTAAYEQRYAGLMDDVSQRLAALAPDDADPAEVARQIVRVVGMPNRSRPFRVYIDPADDGAEDVVGVGDRVREWLPADRAGRPAHRARPSYIGTDSLNRSRRLPS